jgi:ADP-ribose pyrophosphatase YjhB (NUDIX family)
MQSPDLKDSFVYEGETYQVDWFDLPSDQPLPQFDWQQVYMIGNVGGMVPVVCYARDEKPYNLPGGKFEQGETPDETIRREAEEELNMRVRDWHPIGYQIVYEPNGKQVKQLRVYATLEKIGEFINDPGGNVIGNKLVSIGRLNNFIEYGSVGERMLEIVRPHFATAAQKS